MKMIVIMGSLCAVLAATGCAEGQADTPNGPSGQASPVELTNCGLPLAITAPPRRAIALEQNATEIMLSLGLADLMAGTSYQTDPVLPQLRPAYEQVPVLARLYPSREAVRAANPDFVYSTYTSGYAPDAAGSRADLARLGVPAYLSRFACENPADAIPTVSFDGIFGEIRDIAAVFGVPDRGEKLIREQQGRLDTARGTVPTSTPNATGQPTGSPSLLWYYSGTTTPYVAGHGGVPDAVSSLLGARNAFTDVSQKWPAGNWEEIAEGNPDVIVLADLTRGGDSDIAESKIDFLRRNPVTSKLAAVVAGRFVTVPGSSMDPSIRSVEAAELVGAGLRGFVR
ncbi:ABC transporter substrate-binding protein [Plantactinospora sp. KLBMP9567]|uniref:ABC transporter substrate-binding protein n=1 Tax=Plantactinospora sp. KLBMP9567 TaxID=3085900 RepID=UPI002980DC59|nr:ABC transporter substrate-binding protein [Plantactinospora sp. KLBMP9567]MDW5324186.1 ABC transporter substrate-binding protein [Plantactinospora sp. KLBMP9567]